MRSLLVLVMMASLVFNAAAQNSNSMVARPVATPHEPPTKSTVRGKVYYTDSGRPVRRATLMLLSSDFSDGPSKSFTAVTDSEGNFEFKNVRAGSYFSMVNSPGIVTPMAFADWSQISRERDEKAFFEGAFSEFEKIVVDGLTDTDIQIPARRGGAVSGRVMYADGEPAVGIKVDLLRRSGDRFVPLIANFSSIFAMLGGGGNQTDDRGMYRFAGLPRGEYKIKVTENISHSNPGSDGSRDVFFSMMTGGNSLVTVYYPDLTDAAKAQVLNVELGTELPEINVLLPNHNLHRVAGTVVAAKDKKPVKNAEIKLKKKGDDTVSLFNELRTSDFTAKTDEEGKWYFKELPKGTYEIVIDPPAPIIDAMTASNLANTATNVGYAGNSYYGTATNSRPSAPKPPRLAKKVQEVTVDDKDISEMVVELGYGANITGTVSTDDGKDLPEALSIEAINENEQAMSSTYVSNSKYDENQAQTVKSSSSFKIESVAVGNTTFRIRIPDDDFYVKSATAGGKDLLSGNFALKEGETIANVQIVVSRNTGTLKGTVVDTEKEPAANAQFTLVPTDAVKRKNTSFYYNFYSAEDGSYFVKAAPGDYAIVFNMRKKLMAKPTADYDKWLDDTIKSGVTVTIKPGETTTQKLTAPKK